MKNNNSKSNKQLRNVLLNCVCIEINKRLNQQIPTFQAKPIKFHLSPFAKLNRIENKHLLLLSINSHRLHIASKFKS